MSRDGIIELLGEGWVTDTHLNAFAYELNFRRAKSPRSIKNFLYISPDHAVNI